MAEQAAHNRLVEGSNPSGPTFDPFLHKPYFINMILVECPLPGMISESLRTQFPIN
jgi:hypothetical protein